MEVPRLVTLLASSLAIVGLAIAAMPHAGVVEDYALVGAHIVGLG